MPKSVGEYRPHASSGVPDARVLVPVLRASPSDRENGDLSWSLKSKQEVTKDKRGPTSEVEGPGHTVTLRIWALG